jgi:transposase
VRHKDCRVDLYDLKADYLEQNNLVDNPAYSTLMDEFDERIRAHMAATGDDWDMCAHFPPPDWVTHAEAKEHLEKSLLPNAVVVP